MEEDDQKELQLLPTPSSFAPSRPLRSPASDHPFDGPSLDLQLSISLSPISKDSCLEALKWQAAEQIRLVAMEKAYVERLRELGRRETKLAQSEFARARLIWERARTEVKKEERMKEAAIKRLDSSCIEITCLSCRQKFQP